MTVKCPFEAVETAKGQEKVMSLKWSGKLLRISDAEGKG